MSDEDTITITKDDARRCMVRAGQIMEADWSVCALCTISSIMTSYVMSRMCMTDARRIDVATTISALALIGEEALGNDTKIFSAVLRDLGQSMIAAADKTQENAGRFTDSELAELLGKEIPS